MRRDRSQEIRELKARSPYGHGFLSFEVEKLRERWRKNAGSSESEPDFYIIRLVTLLEVFARRNIGELIDHSRLYTDRAVELSKHFKMDFELLRDIQGRAITLGDIVAHSVPINAFSQIISYFETLLDKPVRPLLSAAVDRWSVEIEGKPSEPILRDFDRAASTLTRLFEIRHIVCHELPSELPIRRKRLKASSRRR